MYSSNFASTMWKNKRINRADYFMGNRFHATLHIISPKNLI